MGLLEVPCCRYNFSPYRFVGEVLQCAIFPPVLKCEKESVFDEQFFGRLTDTLVKCFVGLLQNVQHGAEGVFFDSEESLELPVADCQGFLDAFGLNQHSR